MGKLAQLKSLFTHIRPDAVESILDSYFASFWEEVTAAGDETPDVADMTPEEKMILLMRFISQDGADGEVVRDLFFNLVANNGGEGWVKQIAELAE